MVVQDIERLRKVLERPQKVVVTMHERPDGDALGSALGWARWLAQHGHKVKVICPTVYPAFLGWLPGIEEMLVFEKDAKKATAYVEEAEVIFCLDFGELHRLGEMQEVVAQSNAQKIIIDHHLNPADFATITICEPNKSATSLLLYVILAELDKEEEIDKDMATCFYVGILTDTGSFGNGNTTAEAHFVAGKLLKKGVDVEMVHACIYGNTPLKKLRFMAHAILNCLVVLPKHQVAYFSIPRKDFIRFNIGPGDTAGLVKYALNLSGVTLAVLITEHKGSIRFSFRSEGRRTVNELASMYFNGGGHPKASGGILYKASLKEGEKRLIRVLNGDFE